MYFDYCPTIFDIDYNKYKNLKVVLLDIDNTLAPFKDYEINDKIKDYLNNLKNLGYDVLIYSNASTRRIQYFAKEYGIRYFTRACKPFSTEIKHFLKNNRYKPDEVLLIGDQLFTDVFCANRYKIHVAWVEPLSKKEDLFTTFKRVLEYPKKKKARQNYNKEG